VRYAFDANHERVYDLRVSGVTDAAGSPQRYERSMNGSFMELKIGDPSRMVSGTQTYLITYVVFGVLNSFPDHDELYWNVNGSSWPVSTGEVFAMVHLEGGGLTRAQCYEGATGSQEPCNFLMGDDRAGFVTKRSMASGEQLTIVAAIRKGAVSEPTPLLVRAPTADRDAQSYFSVAPPLIGISIGVLLAGAAILMLLWWRHGRDRVFTTIYYLSQNPEEETRPSSTAIRSSWNTRRPKACVRPRWGSCSTSASIRRT